MALKKPLVKKSTPTKKAPPKTTPTDRPLTMEPELVKAIKLEDNREIRILRIPTGTGQDLIRIGINLLPGGENMSGAVFPESFIPDVVNALREAR
jgi:hypothetical protein